MTQDSTSGGINQRHLSAQEAIIASVPKDAFKAMFYMFAGKPDSKVKVLDRSITLKPEDISDLNDKIISKLRLHQIDQIVSSAVIKFEKEESIELGTWAEFESFDWKISDVTEELTFRWDFLIKLPAYKVPQRHTLTIRFSAEPRLQDLFQVMVTQDPDDDQDISNRLGLCVVRVDFISHRLADELIDVAEQWINSLRQPESAHNWFSKCSNWDSKIARTVHLSVPIFMTALAISILRIMIPRSQDIITNSTLLTVSEWLLISGLGLFILTRFSHYLAGKCYHAINKYGDAPPFRMTRGDEGRIDKFKAKNRRHLLVFLLSSGFALVINIIAAIISWYILPK